MIKTLLFFAQLLTWAPPPCGDATHTCVDVNIAASGHQAPTLNANTDYRLHLPATAPQVGGIGINGGRNVILIGGQIDLTVPCSDAQTVCHGINISKPTPGAVHIEGVWIRNPQSPITQSTGDGIDVDDRPDAPNSVTIENVRIDGISGCSGGADHADAVQPYLLPDAPLQIDRLTVSTNCQGLQIDPDLAYSMYGTYPTTITVKNTNVTVLPNPYLGNSDRYAFWLTYNLACNSGPIMLQNVSVAQPSGTLAVHGVWPDTDGPAACKSVWNAATKQLTFPNSPQIQGFISAAVVADYVPAGKAGLSYVSPGYQTASTAPSMALSWSASTDNIGVTSYGIERCTGAACSNFATLATVTGTTYQDANLGLSTSYSYRVRAADLAGNWSPYSAVVTAVTQDRQAPTAPTNLTVLPQ